MAGRENGRMAEFDIVSFSDVNTVNDALNKIAFIEYGTYVKL